MKAADTDIVFVEYRSKCHCPKGATVFRSVWDRLCRQLFGAMPPGMYPDGQIPDINIWEDDVELTGGPYPYTFTVPPDGEIIPKPFDVIEYKEKFYVIKEVTASGSVYLCSECVPIDASIIGTYIALIDINERVREAEEDREAAEQERREEASEREETYLADHNRAADDHSVAVMDHSSATADHSTAQEDHTLAESDHATAVSDHAASSEAAIRATAAAEEAEHMVDIHRGPRGYKGDTGNQGPVGPVGPAGVTSATVSVDQTIGTPSAVASVADGVLSISFSGIKGEQGNSGYQGAAGELEIVNNLNDGGSASALSAEMGKVLNERYTQGLFTSRALSGEWRQGTLTDSHKYTGSNSARIIIAIPCDDVITFDVESGYYASVHSYSERYVDINQITNGESYIENTSEGWIDGSVSLTQPTGGKTFVIVVKSGSAGTASISPSDGTTAITDITGFTKLKDAVNSLSDDMYGYGVSSDTETDSLSLLQGGIDSDGTDVTGGPYFNYRVRSEYYRVYGDFSLDIVGSNDKEPAYNIYFYSGSNSSYFDKRISSSFETSLPYSGNYIGYLRVLIKDTGSSAVSPADFAVSCTQSKRYAGLIEKVEKLYGKFDYSEGYVRGPDMLKNPVRVSQVGTLSYLQAFCINNGKYYSTDGSNIAEQDSSFAVLRDVPIDLAHGNSLQLVSGGKAWASGWNDNKMYRVDLSTLSVDQTITLPTTGYTTAAVDEADGKMYIFQRASYPNTPADYNFIVYDYVNETIISSRVIETFAALQSVDYYQGKILMLFGLGTVVAPSGMRIYNTAGDVLVTYDLNIFESTEPEGICINRDTLDLFVTDANKSVFKVSSRA